MRKIIALSAVLAFIAVSLLAPATAEARSISHKSSGVKQARTAVALTAPGLQRLQLERTLQFIRALEIASAPVGIINPLTIIDEPDPTGDTPGSGEGPKGDQDKRPKPPKKPAPEKRAVQAFN